MATEYITWGYPRLRDLPEPLPIKLACGTLKECLSKARAYSEYVTLVLRVGTDWRNSSLHDYIISRHN